MKSAVRKLILFCAACAVLCIGSFAAQVEQVQVCMPAIDVYLYADGDDLGSLTAGDITASLGETPLAVSSFGLSEEGTFYVYMLDISASIPDAHFSAARAALLDAYSRLRAQDAFALITFGSDVRLLLSGGESRQTVTATLDALDNSDANTRLYDAMNQLIELVSGTEDMRRVAVVISDGMDDTDAGMTQEALESELVRTGISVSALCVDTASDAAVSNFRDFLGVSGGQLFTFGPDNAETQLDALLDGMGDGWHLALEAPDNRADGQETPLTVALGDVSTLSLTVTPERWTPDTVPPRVTDAVYDAAAGTVTVTFSEPMDQSADAGAYALTDGSGAAVPIASVEAMGQEEALLRLGGPLPETGEVTLTVGGLHDVSMEENALTAYSGVIREAAALPSSALSASATAAVTAEKQGLSGDTITLIIVGVAILLAALAAGVIVRMAVGRRERPKREKKPKDRCAVKADPQMTKFIFMQDDRHNHEGK